MQYIIKCNQHMTETILINLFHIIIYIDKDKTVKYHIRVCLSIDFLFFCFVPDNDI